MDFGTCVGPFSPLYDSVFLGLSNFKPFWKILHNPKDLTSVFLAQCSKQSHLIQKILHSHHLPKVTMNLAFFNFSWPFLITDFWLGQVIYTWENCTLLVLCKNPYNLGPFNKNWPWKRKSLLLERLLIALLRLPLKIPSIMTGYILSLLLCPIMSRHHHKSLRAAISLQNSLILHCNDFL